MPFHCVRCNREIDRSFKACPHCGEPVTDFLREYADKPIDGKYRILSRLGAGGMGEVYKVEHTFLGAVRVIKVVRPQISESGEAHDRFLREARLATKIHHQNVATLHDFAALPDGSHYMVWEFIEGENLAQVMRRRGVLPPREAVAIMKQALAGLEAIHRAGIVHRDISPENLMITREADGTDRVKIIDLGVAKGDDAGETSAMTKTGIFVGKLRYCSPEHLGFLADGEKIDGRADLYSLAIVLVEILTGRPPFEATSPHQYILHHSRETEVKPIDFAGVPEALQPVIAHALERDRNKRFASAKEFADALDRVELPAPIDADSTMRLTGTQSGIATILTPLPAVRTEVDAHPTPLPRPPVPTLATPAPSVIGAAPPPRSGSPVMLALFFVVLFLAVLAGGAFIYLRLPGSTTTLAQKTSTTTQASAVPVPVPQSQATINVTETTASTAPDTTTTAAPMPVTPAPQPVVPQPQPLQPVTKPKPQPVKPAEASEEAATDEQSSDAEETSSTTFPTYTEGGSKLANESAINVARMQLKNVRQVALIGAGGHAILMNQLAEALRDLGLSVVDGADVVIYFNATNERLRLGRKRRSAEVTVTRHGRPVLRYVMPAEEYRVGDNPAEAFTRIASDIFNR
jgi:serine/threonine protein kinase